MACNSRTNAYSPDSYSKHEALAIEDNRAPVLLKSLLKKSLKHRMASCLQASSISSSIRAHEQPHSMLDLLGLFHRVSKVWLGPVQGHMEFFHCD